ncbi:hypothetical protein BJV82DRAFT_623601 [Fennellomyces sp. T-0311]|nr:hypothetical protein BJV82DRAFT_623601 [Fennellomyces sp. T-0311]
MSAAFVETFWKFVTKATNTKGQDLTVSSDTTSDDGSCYIETPVDQATAGQLPLPCPPPTVVTSPIPIQQNSNPYPSPGPYLSPYAQRASPFSTADMNNSPDCSRNDFMPNLLASSFGSHSSFGESVALGDDLAYLATSCDQDFTISDLLGDQPHMPPNADPAWLTPRHSPGASSYTQQAPPTLALTATSSENRSYTSVQYREVHGSRASSCSQTPLLAVASSIDSFGSFHAPQHQAPHIREPLPGFNGDSTHGAAEVPLRQQLSPDLIGNTINPQCITTPLLSVSPVHEFSPAHGSYSSSVLGNMMDHLAIASPSVHSEHSVFSQQLQMGNDFIEERHVLQPQENPLHPDWNTTTSWLDHQHQVQQMNGQVVFEDFSFEDSVPPSPAEPVIIGGNGMEEIQEEENRVQQPKKPQPIRRTRHNCPHCSHTSNRANNMREHILTHDPNRPKNFLCDLCPKRFARKHDMKRHRRTHERRKKPRYPASGTVVFR